MTLAPYHQLLQSSSYDFQHMFAETTSIAGMLTVGDRFGIAVKLGPDAFSSVRCSPALANTAPRSL